MNKCWTWICREIIMKNFLMEGEVVSRFDRILAIIKEVSSQHILRRIKGNGNGKDIHNFFFLKNSF